jgi:hypothetical protein
LGIGLVVILSGSLLHELVGCAELTPREAMANPTERTWLEIEFLYIIAGWDWSCPLLSERLRLFFCAALVGCLVVAFFVALLAAVVVSWVSLQRLLFRETADAVPRLDVHVGWLVAENWTKGSDKNAID